MRDRRFIAQSRGGDLKIEQHRQLIVWASGCVEHILPLLGQEPDDRLKNALMVAKEWVIAKATVGDARNASLKSIAFANESSSQISIAIARASGHAVATAHMADHALGAAMYALKAVKYAGKSVDAERKWQNEQLASEIRELVLTTRGNKEQMFKDLRI
jgi:phosphoglycerate dehydrogenase-like enzyme